MSTLLACDIGRKDSKRTGEGGMLSVLSRIYSILYSLEGLISLYICTYNMGEERSGGRENMGDERHNKIKNILPYLS